MTLNINNDWKKWEEGEITEYLNSQKYNVNYSMLLWMIFSEGLNRIIENPIEIIESPAYWINSASWKNILITLKEHENDTHQNVKELSKSIEIKYEVMKTREEHKQGIANVLWNYQQWLLARQRWSAEKIERYYDWWQFKADKTTLLEIYEKFKKTFKTAPNLDDLTDYWFDHNEYLREDLQLDNIESGSIDQMYDLIYTFYNDIVWMPIYAAGENFKWRFFSNYLQILEELLEQERKNIIRSLISIIDLREEAFIF